MNPQLQHRSPRRGLRRRELLLVALAPVIARAAAPLPQRDLLIELREADAATSATGAGGWNVRSTEARAARERPVQQLRVHNGATASLQIEVSRPLQIWQALPGVPLPAAQSAATPGAPAAPSTRPPAAHAATAKATPAARGVRPPPAGPGAALPIAVPDTQWIDAGQRFTVQPRWPGGREPVSVALSSDSSRLDPHVAPGSAELPQRTDAAVVTTVNVPLGQWVTLAATGADDSDMSVVASGQGAARRVLQLRVSLLP